MTASDTAIAAAETLAPLSVALRSRLGAVDNLPTLPHIVDHLQKLTANPRVNMFQISGVIARDQAITARVIRLVNSSFYGLRTRITSIQQAIVILGMNTVKNLVTGVAVVKTFTDSAPGLSFDRKQFWLHSLGCAMGARRLAAAWHWPDPDDYFLAGLLHDVGLLILDQYLHPEFNDVVRFSQAHKIDFVSAERAVLGLTHGEIGEFVAGKWKIPECLINTIRFHHDPLSPAREAERDRKTVSLVHVADVTALRMGYGRFLERYPSVYQDGVWAVLQHASPEAETVFESLRGELWDLIKEWGI